MTPSHNAVHHHVETLVVVELQLARRRDGCGQGSHLHTAFQGEHVVLEERSWETDPWRLSCFGVVDRAIVMVEFLGTRVLA